MNQLTLHKSVDDYLGDGARRFFGAGYRRARQMLSGIEITAGADGGSVVADAGVSYPADWSRKGTTDQLPHLSSIDALLIGGEVAEAYLTHALGLTVAERARLRLRRVRLLAGNTPLEEGLSAFPVRARIDAPVGVPAADRLAVSTVDCRVGTLRARLEVLHPARPVSPGTARFADPDAALGPVPRPYASAHRDKRQRVERIELDVAERLATAELSVTCATPQDVRITGLESGTHRGIAVLDVFVAAIQLGQILLYELDGVPRADSHTLWMRQTTLEIADWRRAAPAAGVLGAGLEDPQLLTDGDGRRWRTARISAAFDDMTIACDVAHRLP